MIVLSKGKLCVIEIGEIRGKIRVFESELLVGIGLDWLVIIEL